MTLPGLTGAVSGVGAASGVTVTGTLTAGDDGVVTNQGFSSGASGPGGGTYGSLTVTLDPNGFTITDMFDDGGSFTYALSGNHTGAAFTTVTVNSVPLARASAADPNGTFTGTHTYWQWPSSPGITTGNPYPYEIAA